MKIVQVIWAASLTAVALGVSSAVSAAGPAVQAARSEDDQDFVARDLRQEAILGIDAAIDKLVARGADVNARGPHGETALEYAILFGHYRTATHLLKLGADPNAEDDAGRTALERAAGDCAAPHMVQNLLGAGAELNHRDFNGRTALMAAVRGDCVKTVAELILSARDRIELDAHDDELETASDLARGGGPVERMLEAAHSYQHSGQRTGADEWLKELRELK